MTPTPLSTITPELPLAASPTPPPADASSTPPTGVTSPDAGLPKGVVRPPVRTPAFEKCLVNHLSYGSMPEDEREELRKHKNLLIFRYETGGADSKAGWTPATHARSTGIFYDHTVYRIDAKAVMDAEGKSVLLHSVTVEDLRAMWNSKRIPFSDLGDRVQSLLCVLGENLQVWTGGNDWNTISVSKSTRGDFISNYAYRVKPGELMKVLANTKAVTTADKLRLFKANSSYVPPGVAESVAESADTTSDTAPDTAPAAVTVPEVKEVITYTVSRPPMERGVPPAYNTNPLRMFAVLRITDTSPTAEDPKLGNMTFMCSRATLEEAEKAVIFYGSFGIPAEPNSSGNRFAICELVKIVAPVFQLQE